MKIQKNEKSNYVVWPTPSSKFLEMARGPKSLAIPVIAVTSANLIRCVGIYYRRRL